MTFKPRYIFIAISVLLALGIMYYFSNLVAYIILAWSLSMIGSPVFRFFKRFLGKNISAMLTLSIFVLIGGILLWIFIPPLLQQARNISNIDYGKAINAIEEPMNDWQAMLEKRGFIKTIEPVVEKVAPIVEHEEPFASTCMKQTLSLKKKLSRLIPTILSLTWPSKILFLSLTQSGFKTSWVAW